MKRVAEWQLVKDGAEDEDMEEPESGQGFTKADENVMATRKIRALPRRSIASGASNPPINGSATPETPPPPKPAAFGGFGLSSSAPTPFTFSSPTQSSASTISPSAAASPIFNASSAPPPLASPTLTSPLVASNASHATKAFATFLAPGSSSQPPDATMNAPDIQTSASTNDATSKYYAALRGINVSFVTALSKALEIDPFLDAAGLMERYKNLRLDAQKELDGASNLASTNAMPASHSVKLQPAMPSAPSSFAGFGFGSSSSGSSSGSGFTPNLGGKPAPSFGSTVSPSDSSSSAAGPPAPAESTAFGSTTSALSKSSLGFAFGSTPSSSNPFAPSKTPTTSSAFTFGSSAAKPDTSTTTASLFGTSSSTAPVTFGPLSPSSSDGLPASSGLPENPFASGSSAPKPSTFGGFGSGFGKSSGATGSIGNPVGFGFGTPPQTPDASRSNSVPHSNPFTFGAPAASTSDKKQEDGGESREGSVISSTPGPEGEPDHSQLLASKNPNDEEGEGEENEETIHAIKLKAFRLDKKEPKDGGGSGWTELGSGVLRIKKHKESSARRVLLRNSSTGKININFRLYGGLKPSLGKRSVTFVGHHEGVSQTYSVRLTNDDQARELQEVLNREIAFVKAKAETS